MASGVKPAVHGCGTRIAILFISHQRQQRGRKSGYGMKARRMANYRISIIGPDGYPVETPDDTLVERLERVRRVFAELEEATNFSGSPIDEAYAQGRIDVLTAIGEVLRM